MIEKLQSGCDLLVLSPHPDDAEIGLGGTLSLLAKKGHRCWVVDLTGGELGSNATPEIRWREACASAEVLGLRGRARLSLPDGFINSKESDQVARVAHVIRCLRPQRIITAPEALRHPDHVETPHLVAKSCFMAGLIKFPVGGGDIKYWSAGESLPEPENRWQVPFLGRVCGESETPSFFFDISSTLPKKNEALACYSSQFDRTHQSVATHINTVDFLKNITSRSRRWGRMAEVPYAEAIITTAKAVYNDLPEVPWK